MVSNNSGRLGPSEADGRGKDDMTGTPGNNSDAVRYTRSDATTQTPVPTLLSIGAAQPAQKDIAALMEQVKEVHAVFRERIRIRPT